MRMHIELDDGLVAEVDRLAGPRGRSAFVRTAIQAALRQAARWADIEATAGALEGDHEWDADASQWVRDQRRDASRRAG